jgi:hypothetical protein
MTRDGWAVYDCFKHATHQQCTAHLLRRCNELLETATGMAARFPQQVKDILQHGLRLRDRHAARRDDGARVVRDGRPAAPGPAATKFVCP